MSARFSIGIALCFLAPLFSGGHPGAVAADTGVPGGVKGLITGTVVSDVTSEPLENANVFIAQTFCGTSTGTNGSFVLTPGFQGSYDLVISLVGYERKVIRLQLAGRDTVRLEVRLTERILSEEPVQVLSSRPEEWERRLAAFLRVFIGPDISAEDCTLLNPWVVNFRMSGDTLVASSDSLLRIDNRAFGYSIRGAIGIFRWDLKHDAGVWSIYPRFLLMPATSPEQPKKWDENRRTEYLGSLRHFLRACIAGRWKEEGFTVTSPGWNRREPVSEGMIGINRWAGTSLFEWRYRGRGIIVSSGDDNPDEARGVEPRHDAVPEQFSNDPG